MRVAIVGKIKNGPLWELAQKAGGQAALARILGVRDTELGLWMNFKKVPMNLESDRMRAVERRLAEYGGLLLDDIFPEELVARRGKGGKVDVDASFDVVREVSISQLNGAERQKWLVAAAEDRGVAEDGELELRMARALGTLTPRLAEVMRKRFGFDGREPMTMQEVAAEMGVSRSQVARLEATALMQLRHPSRSRRLKGFL